MTNPTAEPGAMPGFVIEYREMAMDVWNNSMTIVFAETAKKAKKQIPKGTMLIRVFQLCDVEELAHLRAEGAKDRADAERWPDGLQAEHIYKAKCDMDPLNSIAVLVQTDGDVCVSIFDRERGLACVEFCTPSTGGGKSPNTWNALRHLANAIRLDAARQTADPS